MVDLKKEQKALGKKCTPLQRKYVINLVGSGMSQREAYLKAGGTAKTETAQDNSASIMLSNTKVRAFYDSLMDNAANTAILTRDEALEILSHDARTAKDRKEKQAAIKQLSAMEGWNATKKHELNGKLEITEIERKIID